MHNNAKHKVIKYGIKKTKITYISLILWSNLTNPYHFIMWGKSYYE